MQKIRFTIVTSSVGDTENDDIETNGVTRIGVVNVQTERKKMQKEGLKHVVDGFSNCRKL